MTGQLPAERRELGRELHALRERAGLSLTALAHRTSASRSSWHRYLKGTKVPPRELVRELCALAQESPEPVLALRERAEAAGRPPEPQEGASSVPDREAGGEPTAKTGKEPAHRPVSTSTATGGEADADTDRTRGSAWQPPALRRWWRPIAAGVLLGSAVAVGVSAAEQALDKARRTTSPPGCRSTGCTGKDPESQGCTHAEHEPVTVVERTLSGGVRMDIRHSKGCAASWARIWLAEVGTRIVIRSPEGDIQEAAIRDRYDAQGYVYTPMIGGMPEQEAEACYFAPSDGRPPEEESTAGNPSPGLTPTPGSGRAVAATDDQDDQDDPQCFAAPR